MSNQVDYEDLVTAYEELGHALYRLFDNQEWTVVHMGGQYRRARIILTEAEFEEIKKLSQDSDDLLKNLLAY